MAQAPSDDQLAETFGVSGELSMEAMLQQAEELSSSIDPHGPGSVSSPRFRGGRGGARGRGQRGRGGVGPLSTGPSGPPGRAPTTTATGKGNHVPVRDNRKAQLEKITESIANTPLPAAPPIDVATTAEIESMSVRSHRMEEELEDVHTELAFAKGRIESLETEQSNLVSMYTNTAHELVQIKEMVLQLTRSAHQTGSASNPAPPRAASIAAPAAPRIKENNSSSRAPSLGTGESISGNPPVGSGSRFKKKTIL